MHVCKPIHIWEQGRKQMDRRVHAIFRHLNGWYSSKDEDAKKDEYQLFKLDFKSQTNSSNVTRVNGDKLNLINLKKYKKHGLREKRRSWKLNYGFEYTLF